ncbi:MAG: hypothetical protein HQL54_01665 [Magnetococcales bacterium]|nr:hypothetical protein [Magnetococcales bacterium]
MTADHQHLKIEDQHFRPERIDEALQQSARLAFHALLPRLQEWKSGVDPSFLHLPFRKDQVDIAKQWATHIRQRCVRTVVFGIGGSSLGGNMLIRALAPQQRNSVIFADNLDPETLNEQLQGAWEETFVLAVSKSGGTPETLSQFLATLPMREARLGKHLSDLTAVITENPNSAIGQIAQTLGCPIIEHPPVGGRFSVLSIVGLLPAAIAGVDIDALIQGASTMANRCLSSDLDTNPAFRMAAAQYQMNHTGRDQSIQMYYGDRLSNVTAWFAQLWAESLGKRNHSGARFGLTPIASRGVTDQHSQLQLYLDGPKNKQFTFLNDPSLANQGAEIPNRFANLEAVAPFAGRRWGTLFQAEFFGTRDTLINRGEPVRTFSLRSGDAVALGELIILLEMETVLTAAFFGIDPFDQPAVEESKILTRQFLKTRTNT